jgi:signal transduction histidine kinase
MSKPAQASPSETAPLLPLDAGQSALQSELAAAHLALAQAEERLRVAEAASRAKTQFLAAASHDLRQPLHALGLFTESLRNRPHAPEQQLLVDNIHAAVASLDTLFTALLDLSHIEAGGVQVQSRDFQIEELWRRLRVHFDPVAFDKGLALHWRGGHRWAHADPVLVERIVRNLVANALRHAADGGVLVAARVRGDHLLLQVWDSGEGIAPVDQHRVFEEFVQVGPAVRSADAGPRRGLGLGLAIVRRLAALMEAPIGLRSVPGKGSVFSLRLPLGPRGPLPVHTGAEALLTQTLSQRRIVVVEADAAQRQHLAALLARWGGVVKAIEALPMEIPAGQPAPDLLIVGLPPADGQDLTTLAARIRSSLRGPVPITFLGGSAVALAADLPAGVHRLGKPVQPNRLRALLAHQLPASVSQPSV